MMNLPITNSFNDTFCIIGHSEDPGLLGSCILLPRKSHGKKMLRCDVTYFFSHDTKHQIVQGNSVVAVDLRAWHTTKYKINGRIFPQFS